MASIISSTVVEDAVQHDGRRWILERHIFDNGDVYDFRYIAESADNVSAIMTDRASWLPQHLADEEAYLLSLQVANG